MMKRVALVIIIALLLLAGCTNVNNNPSPPDLVEHQGIEHRKVYQLPGSTIYYSDKSSILVKDGDQGLTLLNDITKDEFASYPMLSPDETKLAYIMPYEFELSGDIYIYHIGDQTVEKVVEVNSTEQDTAKVVKWLDDQRLLAIIGFSLGTVTRGGDLYLYDLKTEELSLVMEKETLFEEITDVNINGKNVVVEIIEWDENFSSFTTREITLKYEDILESAGLPI